ncbi:MAG: (2Fe-2S)-binding protein [Acidobacteria bacterium]|nr:(2Fe-2S)-binding protein [Acidobacteriota bacterium]
MEQTIQFKLNGRPASVTADGERALLWVLRTDLELTGTKFGCGHGLCGTCTVIVNNEAVLSCQLPVRNVAGKDVLTIEGLAKDGKLHPLQKAFIQHGAIQCGFCTPGMILRGYSLLLKNAQAGKEEIINGMNLHLCRCGTYARVVDAVQTAASELKGGSPR